MLVISYYRDYIRVGMLAWHEAVDGFWPGPAIGGFDPGPSVEGSREETVWSFDGRDGRVEGLRHPDEVIEWCRQEIQIMHDIAISKRS